MRHSALVPATDLELPDPETLLTRGGAGLPADSPEIALRLIATSDLHASLVGYDYCANRPVAGQGLTRIARQIALARAEAANSLLFDNGDFLQGNPLADYLASTRRRRPHPMITAFNTLGYDAATLGNHEFNYGLPFLNSTLAEARFPIVSANIVTRIGPHPSADTTFRPPFALLTRQMKDSRGDNHVLRIGVIGFAPPQIEMWDRANLKGRIRVRDILSAARAWLPILKARGADVIVALSHSGIGTCDEEPGMENAATALAALPEIDAVIAGHSHLVFPGTGVPAAQGVDPVNGLLCGKPAVMPGHSGSHLGIIDLTLKRRGFRGWFVASGRSLLSQSADAENQPARALHNAVGPDHRAALAWSRRVIGETRVPLHTHFATIAPNAAIDVIADAKVAHVRRALAGTEWADLPLLASAAPFRCGGRSGAANFTDIAVGPLRMRSVSDLYAFPNSIVTLDLTGADVSDWLEHSAGIFHRIASGAEDAVLHDADVPSFRFDIVNGVSFAVDLSQPARFDTTGKLANPFARRIVGISYQGQLLTPETRVLLVTNSHRASEYAGRSTRPLRVVGGDGERVQAVLHDHVRRHPAVGAPPRRNWRFLPMPGTTVTVRAGSGSEAYLTDLQDYRPERIAGRADGFSHYRLHL